jgi:CRISPR/Cas system-associated exonuclease Cas4 (RecB family)
MLESCPCFERAEATASSDYRDRGSILHGVFEDMLRGKETSVKLTPFEQEQLEWAVNHVLVNKSSEFPLEIEQRMVLLDEDFNVITFGTGDVLNGPRLFDLKTGEYHNYWLQVACYALMQMDRIEVDRATVDLLFIRHKNVHQIDVSREEATRRIMKVVKAVLDPDKKPRANAYCRWCRKVMTCSAVVHLVSGLEHERHEITDPEELSAALMTAKTVKEWPIGRRHCYP